MQLVYNFDIFCNNFALLRKRLNLTIEDISKATNINTWELLHIEIGAKPEDISCNTLLKLCDFFNISISEIFTPVE